MAEERKYYVTQAGFDDLKKELDNKVKVERPQVIIELQEARAQGDLSENADYDAARERQAQVEDRIKQLEIMIKNAVIISEEEAKDRENLTVGLVRTVILKDLTEDQEYTFTIVGSIEADPFNGKLSNNTALAEAIMDKKVGDRINIIRVESPYEVEILDIK